jgi:LmbE family N-acetylglucosaminyl deacetylase
MPRLRGVGVEKPIGGVAMLGMRPRGGWYREDTVLEGGSEGRPYVGKVLAAVQAHADDIPFYCAGAVAKLVAEGYTAYLIQTTNDEKCGPTRSIWDTVLRNEQDVEGLAEVLGFREVFNLGYRNHRMDGDCPLEIRARLVFLFRLLKVDMVFTFNPWGVNEENPDQWVTGRAVDAARWMAAMDKDYPEHLAAGLEPHTVQERYHWVAREGQPFNRVVDISDFVEEKVEAMAVNKAQGPCGSSGSRLRARLAEKGLALPELGEDDETADREYTKLFFLDSYREVGEAYGVGYGEAFYHIAPGDWSKHIDDYVAKHAVTIG